MIRPLAKIATVYSTELTHKDMLKLLSDESSGIVETTLYQKLTKMDGISNVVYDDCCGGFITMTIEAICDDPGTLQRIHKVITEHLKEIIK